MNKGKKIISLKIKFLLLTIILIGVHSIISAQENIDENNLVGFGCFFEGAQSKSVEKVSRLLYQSKYKSIIKLLNSKNVAEKYLSVIVCEKLQESGKINLIKEDSIKIQQAYNSKDTISVCSGCTYFDKITLKDLLNKNNPITSESDFWLAKNLKN